MIRLNHLALNQCHLNFSTDGAVGIPKKKGSEIPSAIRDSMVLWYDLKKQGATNETMAADPRIIDHSGNGHHATCYNFAWGGMSGIGGYDFNLREFIKFDSYDEYTDSFFRVVTPINNEGTNGWLLGMLSTNQVPEMRIRVTGIGNNSGKVNYRYVANADDINVSTYHIDSDGEYVLPKSVGVTESIGVIGFIGRIQGMTIEMTPLYPNALVSDGVDDYAVVNGLPILTRERGYTVIAKRKWIKYGNGTVCSKSKNSDGAFQLERVNGKEYPNTSVSFNKFNNIAVNYKNDFVYQTVYDYNGVVELNTQDVLDTDYMSISAVNISSYYRYSSISLYSLILFDRDLTTEEIEWVKNNLITE